MFKMWKLDLRSSFAYIAATAVVMIVYQGIGLILEIVLDTEIPGHGHLILLSGIAVLAIGFYPLAWALNRLFKSVLPRPQDRSVETLKDFSLSLSAVRIEENLGERVIHTLSDTLGLSGGALVRINPEGQEILFADGFSKEEQDSAIAAWHDCTHKQQRQIANTREWTFVPLCWQTELIGILVFRGEEAKKLDKLEMKILETLAPQVAVAIHNRELYEELKLANALTHNLFASLPGGVMAWNSKGNIVLINSALATLVGRRKEELLGVRITRLPGFRKLWRVLKEHGLNGPEEIHNLELVFSDQNYKPRTFNITFVPFKVGGEHLFGLVLTDITEIREMQVKLARGDRLSALGIMTAGLAHEMRNGLHGIQGFAGILEGETVGNDSFHHMAKGIREDSERLTRLLNNFLLFARKPDLQLIELDLKEIIMTSVGLVKRLPQSPGIEINTVFPPDDNKVLGDKDKLYQVFINLLLNALEAPRVSKVDIKLAFTQDSATVVIKDNGAGILEKDREKIFDPFFTTKSGGTGLGLSIVHQIIKEHHGDIDIVDTSEGARVVIKLPSGQEE
jgi:PAS domain S-box-containing protein